MVDETQKVHVVVPCAAYSSSSSSPASITFSEDDHGDSSFAFITCPDPSVQHVPPSSSCGNCEPPPPVCSLASVTERSAASSPVRSSSSLKVNTSEWSRRTPQPSPAVLATRFSTTSPQRLSSVLGTSSIQNASQGDSPPFRMSFLPCPPSLPVFRPSSTNCPPSCPSPPRSRSTASSAFTHLFKRASSLKILSLSLGQCTQREAGLYYFTPLSVRQLSLPCNNLASAYKKEPNKIKKHRLHSADIGCTPPSTAQTSPVQKALDAGKSSQKFVVEGQNGSKENRQLSASYVYSSSSPRSESCTCCNEGLDFGHHCLKILRMGIKTPENQMAKLKGHKLINKRLGINRHISSKAQGKKRRKISKSGQSSFRKVQSNCKGRLTLNGRSISSTRTWSKNKNISDCSNISAVKESQYSISALQTSPIKARNEYNEALTIYHKTSSTRQTSNGNNTWEPFWEKYQVCKDSILQNRINTGVTTAVVKPNRPVTGRGYLQKWPTSTQSQTFQALLMGQPIGRPRSAITSGNLKDSMLYIHRKCNNCDTSVKRTKFMNHFSNKLDYLDIISPRLQNQDSRSHVSSNNNYGVVQPAIVQRKHKQTEKEQSGDISASKSCQQFCDKDGSNVHVSANHVTVIPFPQQTFNESSCHSKGKFRTKDRRPGVVSRSPRMRHETPTGSLCSVNNCILEWKGTDNNSDANRTTLRQGQIAMRQNRLDHQVRSPAYLRKTIADKSQKLCETCSGSNLENKHMNKASHHLKMKTELEQSIQLISKSSVTGSWHNRTLAGDSLVIKHFPPQNRCLKDQEHVSKDEEAANTSNVSVQNKESYKRISVPSTTNKNDLSYAHVAAFDSPVDSCNGNKANSTLKISKGNIPSTENRRRTTEYNEMDKTPEQDNSKDREKQERAAKMASVKDLELSCNLCHNDGNLPSDCECLAKHDHAERTEETANFPSVEQQRRHTCRISKLVQQSQRIAAFESEIHAKTANHQDRLVSSFTDSIAKASFMLSKLNIPPADSSFVKTDGRTIEHNRAKQPPEQPKSKETVSRQGNALKTTQMKNFRFYGQDDMPASKPRCTHTGLCCNNHKNNGTRYPAVFMVNGIRKHLMEKINSSANVRILESESTQVPVSQLQSKHPGQVSSCHANLHEEGVVLDHAVTENTLMVQSTNDMGNQTTCQLCVDQHGGQGLERTTIADQPSCDAAENCGASSVEKMTGSKINTCENTVNNAVEANKTSYRSKNESCVKYMQMKTGDRRQGIYDEIEDNSTVGNDICLGDMGLSSSLASADTLCGSCNCVLDDSDGNDKEEIDSSQSYSEVERKMNSDLRKKSPSSDMVKQYCRQMKRRARVHVSETLTQAISGWNQNVYDKFSRVNQS